MSFPLKKRFVYIQKPLATMFCLLFLSLAIDQTLEEGTQIFIPTITNALCK